MTRILIIGNPGSGKSTLAKKIGQQTGLKIIHLDAHFWTPGWIHLPFPDWISKVEELVQEESWVIDGNYARTLGIRLERADGVIWLDFPRWISLYRCIKRNFYGKSRPDLAPGCIEKLDWKFISFISYVWKFRNRERPIVEQTLQFERGNIPILHLKSHRDVNWEKIIEFITSNEFVRESV